MGGGSAPGRSTPVAIEAVRSRDPYCRPARDLPQTSPSAPSTWSWSPPAGSGRVVETKSMPRTHRNNKNLWTRLGALSVTIWLPITKVRIDQVQQARPDE